jgi:hypothetical protein
MDALERDRIRAGEGTENRDALLQATHALAGWIERDSDHLELRRKRASSTDAELHPAPGEDIERGSFHCREGWVAEVVLQNEGADPDRRGYGRHGRERWTDRELATEMIGHQEGVVTQRFGTLGTVDPAGAVYGNPALDSEPERSRCDGHRRALLQAVWRSPDPIERVAPAGMQRTRSFGWHP